MRSGADLNLGCPQDIAREERFGAYLLGKKDWPLVQGIGERPFLWKFSTFLRVDDTPCSFVPLALVMCPCLRQITSLQSGVFDTYTCN